MTDVNYDQLSDARSAASGELMGCLETMNGLANKLREGVTFEEACGIADRFWEGREASEIKLRLYDSFPKENGQVILGKGLDKRVSDKISTELTQSYFAKACAYIQFKIDESLTHINSLGLDNMTAATAITDLRRQVARYLGFINWGVYEIKTQLLDAGPKCWSDLIPTVESVETGDYLFLENLGNLVDKAHKDFGESNFPQKDSISLSDADWRFGTLETVMELSILFAGYLHEFESKIGNKEVVA